MTLDKKSHWLSGIWQTLLGAAVIGAWTLWWNDRGRITKLENEKQILQKQYEDEIKHIRNKHESDMDTMWREMIVHESMLRDLQKDIVEVRTTREIILSLARPRDDIWSPQTENKPDVEEDEMDYELYEQKAAGIDDNTIREMVEQKGAKYKQQRQVGK